jgi:NADH-quinone oxidoreductase subunit J
MKSKLQKQGLKIRSTDKMGSLLFSPIQAIFYLFALTAIISALMVITAKHPVKSVLSLVVCFFAMAGVWMLLEAEFLSLILLLVYVGAVMTLFLFVVMMLSVDKEAKKASFAGYFPIGLVIVLLMTGLIIAAIYPHVSPVVPRVNTESNLQQLGQVLYTTYAYPFEIAGVLLLVAIIAAITLTHRPPRRLVQRASDQIAVRPEDRIRLVKMPADKKES